MLENNKTNKFVSIIVSLITNVFFALGYCLKFVLPPLVILVKIIVAIFSLVFHLGSKSSSDDDYQETTYDTGNGGYMIVDNDGNIIDEGKYDDH